MAAIDERLQHWVVGHRVEALDWSFLGVSYAGSFGLVWVAIAAAVALVRGHADVLVLTVAAVAVADVTAIVLKTLIGRPRPYLEFPEQEPLLTSAFEGSFPSGHAATSFAGAVVVLRVAPRLAPLLLALAVATAWSRVYVGVHYPSDIVAGAVLGVVVAAALLALAAWARAPRSPSGGRRRSPPPRPPG